MKALVAQNLSGPEGLAYTDVDELWSTLLLGVGPAGAHLVALPREQREALRTAYLDRLGHPEGPFTLGSVARAAVGTVPHPS